MPSRCGESSAPGAIVDSNGSVATASGADRATSSMAALAAAMLCAEGAATSRSVMGIEVD